MSNSFTHRRGNWRRPIVCESKKKPLEEGAEPYPCSPLAEWTYNLDRNTGLTYESTNLIPIPGLPGVFPLTTVWSWIDSAGRPASIVVTWAPGAAPSAVVTYAPGVFGLGGTTEIWDGTCTPTSFTLALTIDGQIGGDGSFFIQISP